MDCVGFKVAREADLDAFARRIEAVGTKVEEVPAGEQPGVGRRLSFLAPSGHRIELFSQMALSEHGPMTRNPELWRDKPHGMRVTRFDHCNLHGPNIDAVVEFFTDVLDFSLTEAAENTGRNSRRVPQLLQQGPRRRLHQTGRARQVSSRRVLARFLARGRPGRRHHRAL
jgi:catechol 2,3-dioxygenase-like lactoylglutathione lyase family enzyme